MYHITGALAELIEVGPGTCDGAMLAAAIAAAAGKAEVSEE
jgi:hypothetical protein